MQGLLGGLPFELVIFIAVLVVIYVFRAIRIVQQYEKGLVETLGQYTRTASAGLVVIFPPFQALKKVDMREQVIDVPPQDVITKDNVMVTVDAVIYFQITDPVKVVYNVANFSLAALKLAQTNLRNVIGDMELDQTLTSREKINVQLRTVLDEATDKWGVKVTRVEIQKIDPPRDITDAMSKQMKAEREKRANILEAEGLRQAAILKAEGSKQSAILQAEGGKQSAILEAEGRAEAIRRVADAEKYQTETVYNAIHAGKPTNDLIAIKYLETLAKVADGEATKIFLPLETSGVMGSIAGVAELFKDKQAAKPQ
jgi:regulator of protease activity HflC (stomatin/prohibitin superfamily)